MTNNEAMLTFFIECITALLNKKDKVQVCNLITAYIKQMARFDKALHVWKLVRYVENNYKGD